LYTFDMRKMNRAMMVHKDHVSAVYVTLSQAWHSGAAHAKSLTWTFVRGWPFHSMDVAYSPTGREFVSGSYDRTIRIFNVRSAKSREVYHTQRMQRYVLRLSERPCQPVERRAMRTQPPAPAQPFRHQ
jgi:WD repeat and SOF domain-containing protein 1